VTPGAIRALVAGGELQRVGRSGYLASPKLTGEEGWHQDVVIAAAVSDGIVTGQSAAALHQLDGYDPGVPVTVAVGPRRSSRSGARRSALLRPPARIGPVDVTAADETLLGLHEPRVDGDSHRYTRLSAAGDRLLLFTFTDIEHRAEHVVRATMAARAAGAA
jgi:hypothetical protein